MSELTPPEEVAESGSGEMGDFGNAPTVVPERNVKEGRPVNQPTEQPTTQIEEE